MATGAVDKSSSTGGESLDTAYSTILEERSISLKKAFKGTLEEPNPKKALEGPFARYEKALEGIEAARAHCEQVVKEPHALYEKALEGGEEARASFEQARQEDHEQQVLNEARGGINGNLKASGPGRLKQTTRDISLVSFTMTSTNHELDRNQNDDCDPAAEQFQTGSDGQFTAHVLFTLADFNLTGDKPMPAISHGGNNPGDGSTTGSTAGQSSGVATGITKKRQAENNDSDQSGGAATSVATGRKKHKTSNNASSQLSGAAGSATGDTITAQSSSTTNPYPADKYGFHILETKNKIQVGDHMRIPLTAGANPTLPNDNFVIMEYRGRRTKKSDPNWVLMISTPKHCTAKGPNDFKAILNQNGIGGYEKKDFSGKAEILRHGQSLGSITAMKQQLLDEMRRNSS